uniref:Uncharacterized protein n=1 Tax=Arundo donax TaxID=35708 RepID=A0A0A8ZQN7_ARUDO
MVAVSCGSIPMIHERIIKKSSYISSGSRATRSFPIDTSKQHEP